MSIKFEWVFDVQGTVGHKENTARMCCFFASAGDKKGVYPTRATYPPQT